MRLLAGDAPAYVSAVDRKHEFRYLPIALAAALLLHTLGVSVDVARLGEVTRETFFSSGGTISDSTVVTIVGLVATSHCSGENISMFSDQEMLHKQVRDPFVCRIAKGKVGGKEDSLVLTGVFEYDLKVAGA